jgi:isochorismate hydrolase
MLVPELHQHMISQGADLSCQVAITGIEAHICVSQTALDLLAAGYLVYVLADGVSSSRQVEAKIALERLGRAGAVITTSEAWLYECMGDANIEKFKEIARLVKDTKENTKEALEALCKL